MPRPLRTTRGVTAIALGATALLTAACGDAEPWQAADWRPQSPPQRVVLASVLAAESLLEVLPDERIAGVHRFVADPSYSLVADHARGLTLLDADPEALLGARPDIVLADAYTRPETLALLAAAGVPIVQTRDPHGFDDIARNLHQLGRVLHLDRDADALVEVMQQRLDEVRASGEQLPGWRLLCLDGALHTYGEGSLFDAVARVAGARNLAAEHGVSSFRKLDVEEVLAWRPDAIVLAGTAPAEGGRPEWVSQWPGLDLLPCVRDGRLLCVPGPLLSTTSHRLVETAAFVQAQLKRWGAP